MKRLAVILGVFFVSAYASADVCASGGYEAQGFFVVESAKINASRQCVVNLKIDWSKGDYAFRENPNCPLDPSEVQNADLIGPCDWKTGQNISGVLVLRDGKVDLE